MTLLGAEQVGIRNRGVVAPGMWADLVLFHPATVSDHATFEEPHAPSTGIEAV
ncbi:MAG: D-aminoacylase, partial [Gemmatimonadetes bacterium]|nr:D-aminoacylase [Gemmatimonadota bacterium]